MILVYRPELENPPMDKECSIGFSFIKGDGNSENVTVTSGVNRDFSLDVWDKIKGYDVVQRLLSLGALRIEEDTETTAAPPEDEPAAATSSDTLQSFDLTRALRLIEDSFDQEQLARWDAKEQRIRVKNAIARRLSELQGGKG
jgi:hypothetical protein